MKNHTVLMLCICLLLFNVCSQQKLADNKGPTLMEIRDRIDSGAFKEASETIENLLLRDDTTAELQQALMFEKERMQRIQKDFQAEPEAILRFIREFYPELDDDDVQRWETSKALEFKIIDGEKKYFNRAGRNLFRIDPDMRELWKQKHPEQGLTSGSGAGIDLDVHNRMIIDAVMAGGEQFVQPKRIRIRQQVIVDADAVPAGETLRCWIPYPRHIPNRQLEIDLLRSEPAAYTLAPESALQRTIFFEKPAQAGTPTAFSVEYEFTAYGSFTHIDPEQVRPARDPELAEYLGERPPHIVFTPELRALSERIIGDEQNPYRRAQLLFAWIDENIPWASAREYSTISCIPEYARINGHGDCGIQTLLFMTLCRMNGIPSRWQSGWELQPPDDSMHDWGSIYFEPYGWVPMDVTYGLRNSDEPALKWFYLSGMDSYRIIFNDDYSQPFTPSKVHFRSETIDSQRGEVEWQGGNLYFDQWSWRFDWDVIDD